MQSANISSIVVTLLVSHPDKSNVVNLEHSLNVAFKFSRDVAPTLPKFTLFKFWQPMNRQSIFVILDMSKNDMSADSKFPQPQNK